MKMRALTVGVIIFLTVVYAGKGWCEGKMEVKAKFSNTFEYVVDNSNGNNNGKIIPGKIEDIIVTLKNNNTISVAIIDLDGNYNSGSEMQTAIEANGILVEYMTGFPPDLSIYTSVFVCLGIYSYNHILTSFEGQLLADFLNNGGNLYMEGGDTWYYDPPTIVHSMFNIFPEADGANNLGTINGMNGTFTEGMSFNYSGENSWIDHISAISPAFDILENQSPNYGTGVAYDEGSYRTIGTSHEFGGLDDGTSPTTKEELMAEYLNFFGIPTSLQALFGSNTTSVCEGQTVNFYDQSSGVVISWEWSFEGGAPGSSSFQNPTVMYFNEGTYDVTLTVSDGVEYNTLTIEDYITVGVIPEIPATPTGDDEVCTNFVQFSDYTTTGATFADSYIWEILPVEAGAITGTGTTGTVEWTFNWEGTASIRVKGVNAGCGEGEFSEPFEVICVICTGMDELSGSNGIHIFPNPSNGKFTIEFSDNIGKTEITIMNMLNEIVFESKTEIVAGKSINIDLSGNSAGVYFVRIKTANSEQVRKIVIR